MTPLQALAFPGLPYADAVPRRRWAVATGVLLGVLASPASVGNGWSWRPLVIVTISVLLAVAILRVVQRAAAAAAEDAARRAQLEFLAGMSHELRTPLNSVIGFSNVLLKNERGALGPKELQYLERVRANGELLLGVVEEMFARAEGATAGSRALGRSTPEQSSARPPDAPRE